MPVTTRNQAKASNVNPRVETPVFSNANDSDTNTSDHAPPDSPTPEDVVDDDDPPQPTTHKEKGHKRSQSSISICNVSDPSVVQYFHGWQARMDALIEEAKQHGIDIYDEVRLVTEVAERSFAIVKSVEEYKKKNGNAQRDIKVVQFSGATTEDLQRLSWDKILIIDFDALLASVKLHIPAERHDKITSTAPDLRKVLEELEGFIGTQVEAGARISIDQWLIAAHRILKENVGVFVWTELRLSSAKSRPVYIEEEKGNKTTFLTGIIDYGLATIDSTNLSAVAAHILSISTQVPSNETVAALRGYHITFVIIEAKNDREDLQDHIPQVVLQCIAL
ncbi:hypothetical protein EYR40_002920 [Pleurotus pulmonarius]|nr:hypothetical protein EYR40_002920 [Pleurotus pulmonarius]